MSRENLEITRPRGTPERVLMLLKMHGALTASAIGAKLGTTGEAARQHLVRLADEGQVCASSAPSGVGRPTQRWTLTAAGQSRFPDTHASLTVQLIQAVRNLLGEDALDSIVTNREEETRAAYDAKLSACATLQERVTALVKLRSNEGYMADWEDLDDGSILFIENHCPICAAAIACQGFCRSELHVFKSVLGPDVTIERSEHAVRGDRRCTYVIRSMPV